MPVYCECGNPELERRPYRGFEAGLVSKKSAEANARTMVALAEPNRMRIVELLRNGPLTVGEIADRLGLRQPQTSKHLKILSDAGIVEVRAKANRRIYRLRAEPFRALDAWLLSFPQIMEERFDNLDDYLQELQSKQDKRGQRRNEES